MSIVVVRLLRRPCVGQYVAFLKANVGLELPRCLRVSSNVSRPPDDMPPLQLYEVSDGCSESSPLDPPTNCCMSGCANCVWIEYAVRLSEHYGGDKAPHVIASAIDRIEDVNMKAFLSMELKLKT